MKARLVAENRELQAALGKGIEQFGIRRRVGQPHIINRLDQTPAQADDGFQVIRPVRTIRPADRQPDALGSDRRAHFPAAGSESLAARRRHGRHGAPR